MAETALTLEKALRRCDRQRFASHLQAADKKRAELLRHFPLSRWPSLPLADYALGHEGSKDAFCYWMEFGSQELGSIKGGSAHKLVIYKRQNKPGWHYPDRFPDEEAAWSALRAAFIQAFELAEQRKWEELDQTEMLMSCPALKLKTLHLYSPDQVLPVYSTAYLRFFLHKLGQHATAKSSDPLYLNRAILEVLRDQEELSDYSTTELVQFLYWWEDPRKAKRVIKIAPGHDASAWKDCLREGYICINWGDVGDLSQFETKEAFRERFAELYGGMYNQHRAQISKKANELWTLKELEPGDVVVANKGISKILAIGTVKEAGYEFRPDRADFQHTVAVEWDTSHAKEITPQKSWAMVTVAKVNDALVEEIIPPGVVAADPLHLRIGDALERKGQAILYGPPGTGKTYSARRFAVWWLLRKAGNSNAESILADRARFAAAERQLSTLQLERRVWWVVANRKQWSWDRLFAKGSVEYSHGRIQRNYPLVQVGDLVVGYQSTPEKRIVALAKVVREFKSAAETEPTIRLEPLCEVEDGPTFEDLQNDQILNSSEPMRHRNQGTLFALTAAEAEHLLAMLIERNPQSDTISGAAGSASTTGVGALTRVTFHPSYTYEDFIEGYRPTGEGEGLSLRLEDGIFKRVCREAQAHPEQTYLVMVDEINRGNVAKILGELLTLLEVEKRGLTVTLPQSKEAFSVPENVYLLGTMNTADRSIKLLDTALRRRFAFIELMPDYELLRGAMIDGLALDDFLESLNRRIASREGREKQIGHSYLLDNGQPISDSVAFSRRFQEDILPLLQEACYDDYSRLAEYIGPSLIDAENQQLNSEVLADAKQLIAALTAELAKDVANE